MTISYNLNIPDGPNNPSNDQPKMKVNTNAVDSWTAIDHVKFDTSPAGTHKQVTFSSKNAAGAQIDPQSVLYTGNGTASSVAQPFFRNQNGIFQVSPIKAWAYCDSTGAIKGGQSLNIASVVSAGTGRYNVTLTANSVSGTNFGILVSSFMTSNAAGSLNGYNITGVGTFQLVFLRLDASAFVNPTDFSFQVMQI